MGLPAISAVKLIVQAFYSTRDTKTPVWAAAGVLALNVALNIAFLMLFFSQLRNGGPALATVIAAYANCAILFVIFRQRYGRIGGKEIVISSAKALAASAVMGAACWAVVQYAHVGEHNLSVDAALLAATIGGAAAIYLALTWMLRSVELKEVYEIIFHRQVAAADISGGAV
jgi:putative peptidoglycan lipid II flippase